MIIDQQPQISISDPIVQFPDWVFGAVPSQGVGPGPVNREVIFLRGSNVNQVNTTGVVDDSEKSPQ